MGPQGPYLWGPMGSQGPGTHGPGAKGPGTQGAAVSLEIPGIVVSLEFPVFRIFLVKISGKIVKIGFSDSRDHNKISIFS